MKETYDIKYRQPGQIFWRKIKNVDGDGVEGGFRFFRREDETMIYVSINAEVIFPPERAVIINHQMSKTAGQPIQRS